MKPSKQKFFAELNKSKKNLTSDNKNKGLKKVNLNMLQDMERYIEETYEFTDEIETNTRGLKESAADFAALYTEMEIQYNFLKEYKSSLQDKYIEGGELLDNLYTALEELGVDALDSEIYQRVNTALGTLEGGNHVVQEMDNTLREVENYI